MCLDVYALGFARLAEVKVGAIGTSVANTSNGNHATRITLASSVDAPVSSGIILRDAEQKTDDIVASSLLGRVVVRIVPPFIIISIYDGLAITYRLGDRDILVFSIVGDFGVFVAGDI